MKLISHRGNINGRIPELENTPSYIEQALDFGYEVEIDVWHTRPGGWYLGHDKPEHQIEFQWLLQRGLWLHCKNIYAFGNLILHKDIECFFHQNDDYALTTGGYVWTLPNRTTCPSSIVVHPEQCGTWTEAAGICSDYISRYLPLRNHV